jgi:LacI family transcriptional regulator
VVAGNRDGAAAGVRHLLASGHRRIAFIGDLPSIWTASERHDGYVEAMRQAGLDERRLVRRGVRGADAAADVVAELLEDADPPTAVFAAQNVLAIGAFTALRRLGRRGDVALVGFDDFPLADLLDPGVTVVAQNPLAMGRLAADILFGRLDGDRAPSATHVVPTRLIERGSGEIRPTG